MPADFFFILRKHFFVVYDFQNSHCHQIRFRISFCIAKLYQSQPHFCNNLANNCLMLY